MNKKPTFKKRQKIFFLVSLLFLAILIGLWSYLESFKVEVKSIGGTYKEGIVGTPRFINPILAQTQTDKDLTRLFFTPLLSLKEDGSFDNLLVESVEISPDKLKYRINLKKDIYFNDGVNLTAEDLLFTIESIQDPLTKSPLESTWKGVSPKIIDKYSVELTLPRPFGDFLSLLQIGVIPKHIWSKISPQEFIFSILNTKPVAYGPYSIKKIETRKDGSPTEYVLKRYKSAVEQTNIKKISLIFFENENNLIKGLKKNKIDAAYGISPKLINKVPKNYTVYSEKLPRVFALFFNPTENTILESKKIRQALELAIDKQSIVDTVFFSYASEIDSALGNMNFNIPYNPSEAEKLIEEEGWKKNEEGMYSKEINKNAVLLSFDIASPDIEEMKEVAEEIKANLALIGVTVSTHFYEENNLTQNIIRPRNYDALLFGYEIERPSDLYSFWHSTQISDPGLNVSLFKNTELDVALEQLRTGSDNLEKIENLINAGKPAIFLYSPSFIYAFPKNIKGASISVTSASDRFNSLRHWFSKTRHVWPFLIQ